MLHRANYHGTADLRQSVGIIALPVGTVVQAVLKRNAGQCHIHRQDAINDFCSRYRQAIINARFIQLRPFPLSQQIGKSLPVMQARLLIDEMGLTPGILLTRLVIPLPTGAVSASFRYRKQAWKNHVFHLCVGAYGFAPQLGRESISTAPGLL